METAAMPTNPGWQPWEAVAKPRPGQDALGSGAASKSRTSCRRLGGLAGLCMRKVS